MIITMLTETDEMVPPNQDELVVWADEYGQTFPVLSDVDPYVNNFGGPKGEVKLPSTSLIGPGGELLIVHQDMTFEEVIAALPESYTP